MSATTTNDQSRKIETYSQNFKHLVAGCSGGVVTTLILHPFELIKIRFAVDDGRTTTKPQYRGLLNACATIFRQEGLSGLYRGVIPSVYASGIAYGSYFYFYNGIKSWYQNGNTAIPLTPMEYMISSFEAGTLTMVMINPILVVKTRLCVQYENEAPQTRYKGMMNGMAKIYREEGVRGLYRGFVPGMFAVSNGAVQFMLYEEMKSAYNRYRQVPIDTKMGTTAYLTFAAASKMAAVFLTYPYQVLLARMQDHHHSYSSTWDCIKQIWKYERIGGFYKGLSPYLVHIMPQICLVFVLYEKIAHLAPTKSIE